jgi:mono/diheme cytochrome c family protein
MTVSGNLFSRVALLGLALAAALAGCAQRAISSKPLMEPQSVTASSEQPKPASANIGRDLFVARCASCHNERGDKPLRTGLPLNQRKLSREVIAAAVQGRLKGKTQAEQQAVVEYISGLYEGGKL